MTLSLKIQVFKKWEEQGIVCTFEFHYCIVNEFRIQYKTNTWLEQLINVQNIDQYIIT